VVSTTNLSLDPLAWIIYQGNLSNCIYQSCLYQACTEVIGIPSQYMCLYHTMYHASNKHVSKFTNISSKYMCMCHTMYHASTMHQPCTSTPIPYYVSTMHINNSCIIPCANKEHQLCTSTMYINHYHDLYHVPTMHINLYHDMYHNKCIP
jgi:hypothetical protein